MITGCSGGGKSTLVAELARRGYMVVEEPGRRIVRSVSDADDPRLSWNDFQAFAKAAVALAAADYDQVRNLPRPIFFDRGLVDALSALGAASECLLDRDMIERYRYEEEVFVAPPWEEIWQGDIERRHGFDAACAEYDRLMIDYPACGYRPVHLPKTGIDDRADFVLKQSGLSSARNAEER